MSISGVPRSAEPSQTLAPPLEEKEQRENFTGNQRGSWGPLGNVLGGKAKPKESPGTKINSQSDHIQGKE